MKFKDWAKWRVTDCWSRWELQLPLGFKGLSWQSWLLRLEMWILCTNWHGDETHFIYFALDTVASIQSCSVKIDQVHTVLTWEYRVINILPPSLPLFSTCLLIALHLLTNCFLLYLFFKCILDFTLFLNFTQCCVVSDFLVIWYFKLLFCHIYLILWFLCSLYKTAAPPAYFFHAVKNSFLSRCFLHSLHLCTYMSKHFS
jgi:hypothetical protein